MDESLPATAPTAHSGFSKGNLGLHVIITIGTSVCDKSHSLTISTSVIVMAQQEKSCATDLRVAGSSPLTVDFSLKVNLHNIFSVKTNNFCRHSSLVPSVRIKAFVRRLRWCFPRLRPPGPTNVERTLVSG